MPVGMFRSEEGWVQVDYGTGGSIPITRSKYEENKYKPDFDKLPSEAEYWADADAILKAEERFMELTGTGFTAAVRTASGEAVVKRTFDPNAEETLFFPRLVGG